MIGLAAKEDVPPLKAFLFVPHRLIISEGIVKKSEINCIIQKHPEIYKAHYDAEYLILATFIFYERLKGEKSFWHPYFQIINFSDIPMLWNEDEIDELQDQILKKDIIHYRKEFDDEWELIYNTLSKNAYTDYFPGICDPDKKEELKYVFTHSFVSVVTRCFGWGLPKTSMIPFADCINHHNVDSTYELIHQRYHLDVDLPKEERSGPPKYYSTSKCEEDYQDFFDYEASDEGE